MVVPQHWENFHFEHKTCSVPGEWSPSCAKAAFLWLSLGGHRQLTPLHHSEWNTISEGLEEARTWSCKSIQQAMGGKMEDMNNYQSNINQHSFLRYPASERTNLSFSR